MSGTIFPLTLALLVSPCCTDEAAQDPGVSQSTAQAQDPAVPAPPSKFAQFFGPDDSDLPRLETAVTSYRGPDGQTVDLIAAIHIADPAHYNELQELFSSYDALLYEMVAEEGARPAPGERASGILSMFQRGITNALDLEFQLDGVDYTPDNFVHADLDPESMARLMEERGESIMSLLLNAMMMEFSRARDSESAQQLQAFDLVRAFQNREGRHSLRMIFAAQMTEIEAIAAGFGGPDGESVLVEGRNKRALEVFEEQLDAGKKKLGIYYGAAHMPDFEERLLAMGFTKIGERWLTAWNLEPRPDPVAPRYRKKDGK